MYLYFWTDTPEMIGKKFQEEPSSLKQVLSNPGPKPLNRLTDQLRFAGIAGGFPGQCPCSKRGQQDLPSVPIAEQGEGRTVSPILLFSKTI